MAMVRRPRCDLTGTQGPRRAGLHQDRDMSLGSGACALDAGSRATFLKKEERFGGFDSKIISQKADLAHGPDGPHIFRVGPSVPAAV